jgi:hypothetical protein
MRRGFGVALEAVIEAEGQAMTVLRVNRAGSETRSRGFGLTVFPAARDGGGRCPEGFAIWSGVPGVKPAGAGRRGCRFWRMRAGAPRQGAWAERSCRVSNRRTVGQGFKGGTP